MRLLLDEFLPLTVFVLAARSITFASLVPLIPDLLRMLFSHQARTFIRADVLRGALKAEKEI